jgi:hypothetical protein
VPGASPETIKAAYAALARRFHPDRNPQPGAAERMQRINEAYAVLSVPYRRRNYDLERFKAADPLPDPAPEQPNRPAVRPRGSAGIRLTARGVHTHRRLPGAAGALTGIQHRVEAARRHPIWLAAGAAAGGLLLLVCVVAAVIHGGGARPAATATVAGPGVRVVAATTPLLPSTPVIASAVTVVPTPPSARADDVLLALVQHFPPVNALSDARQRPPGADRGWVFSAGGCTVFAGEYDAADRADGARRYWSQQSGRYAYEGSGPVVAAVGDCDTQQHQFEVLNAIADAFAQPH